MRTNRPLGLRRACGTALRCPPHGRMAGAVLGMCTKSQAQARPEVSRWRCEKDANGCKGMCRVPHQHHRILCKPQLSFVHHAILIISEIHNFPHLHLPTAGIRSDSYPFEWGGVQQTSPAPSCVAEGLQGYRRANADDRRSAWTLHASSRSS